MEKRKTVQRREKEGGRGKERESHRDVSLLTWWQL